MGNSQSMQKINFEDIQTVIKNPEIYLLINTLQAKDQTCLIVNTIYFDQEESIINKHLSVVLANAFHCLFLSIELSGSSLIKAHVLTSGIFLINL